MMTFGPAEDSATAQMNRCLSVAGEEARGVLCADHHKGYSMPIGGVLASTEVVMPAAVGYDIGCGNKAVKFDMKLVDFCEGEVSGIMDEIWETLSFGMGLKNKETVDDPVLEEIANSPIREQAAMVDLARVQLGTIGGGNHYVDLFADEDNYIWVGVHFGSRGFGHKTCTGFLGVANGGSWEGNTSEGGMDSVPATIPLATTAGQDYLKAMEIAGNYAYAGRSWVCERVRKILGNPQVLDSVHNHHNYAWWEGHYGANYLVTRKGATPAFPGQRGFVGSNMQDESVILKGVNSWTSKTGLYSTVHGAGRRISRTAAAGKIKQRKTWRCGNRDCDYQVPIKEHKQLTGGACPSCPKDGGKLHRHRFLDRLRDGVIDWPVVQQQVRDAGVELRGGGADEAPGAYKKLTSVLEWHHGTIEIEHRLRPIGVAMAGIEQHDPYKD